MQNKILGVTKRTRVTPFSRRVEAAGVKAYTVYNHMLLPALLTQWRVTTGIYASTCRYGM